MFRGRGGEGGRWIDVQWGKEGKEVGDLVLFLPQLLPDLPR